VRSGIVGSGRVIWLCSHTSAQALNTTKAANASSRQPSGAHVMTSCSTANASAANSPTHRDATIDPSRYVTPMQRTENVSEAKLTAMS
jgi:hypothetical protein